MNDNSMTSDNSNKLRDLLTAVFLLDPEQFRFETTREEVETWDSLGVVSLAVGIQDTFGVHLKPEEALSLKSFQQIVAVLSEKGVSFAA